MFARAKRLDFNKIAIILLKIRKNIFKKFCSNEIVAIFASVKNKTSKPTEAQGAGSSNTTNDADMLRNKLKRFRNDLKLKKG